MPDVSPVLNAHITPFSLDHSYQLTGSYVNKKAPRVRNVKSRIRTMPDLVFTKTNRGDVNLRNVLVSVDGNIAMPEYSENTDELFVKNGAYLLRGTDGPDQNIVFLDFSDMISDGTTISKTYFHKCAPDLIIGHDEKVEIYHNDTVAIDTLLSRNILFWKTAILTIRLSVPTNKVKEGQCQIPLLCFAGRLFFPNIDQLTYYRFTSGDNDYVHIDFTIDLKLLSRIVAANLQHGGIFYGRNKIYHVAITYALSNLFTERVSNISHSTEEWRAIEYMCKADIPFVTLLTMDRPTRISRINPIMPLNDGDLLFPENSKGILIHALTREITDYGKKKYANYTFVETAPAKELFVSRTGRSTLHLSTKNQFVTMKSGGPQMATFFPAGTTFRYSVQDGNCIVARGPDGVIYAKSNDDPFVKLNENDFETRAITDIPTPFEERMTIDPNISIIVIDGEIQYVSYNAQQSQSNRSYFRVLPYTSDQLRWEVYESQLEIPDGMRYQNVMWRNNPVLFADGFNRVEPGFNIKNPEKYFMVDISYVSKVKDETDVELIDDNKNPDRPVKVIEYKYLKNTLKMKEVN